MATPPKRPNGSKSTKRILTAVPTKGGPAPPPSSRSRPPTVLKRIVAGAAPNAARAPLPDEAPVPRPNPVLTAQETPVIHADSTVAALVGATRRAASPWGRFNELAARSIDVFARHGYEVAGDALRYALANVHATTSVQEPSTLLRRYADLANEFAAEETRRAGELARLAGAVQADYAEWFGEFTRGYPVASTGEPLPQTAPAS
jgi:hypothetical protein